MHDWNAVATVRPGAFREAMAMLGDFGEVDRTDYYNILAMRVETPESLASDFAAFLETFPKGLDLLARLMPTVSHFDFQSREEFEEKSLAALPAFIPALAGARFHVRLHRRGFKGRINTPESERALAAAILEALHGQGSPAGITFDNPDAILAVETIGTRAGMSLWNRNDLRRYPFLGLD